MAHHHFTQPPRLNRTPYGFQAGEYCLIAYAAVRFNLAGRYHVDFIPPSPIFSGEDVFDYPAEYHAHRGAVAMRRALHFGLYCLDLENSQRETTRARIDRDRAEYFEPVGIYGPMLNNTLSHLGLRYTVSNHLAPERW